MAIFSLGKKKGGGAVLVFVLASPISLLDKNNIN